MHCDNDKPNILELANAKTEYLETDNDLDHTLGVSDDHNIKQTEYQGSNWEPTDSDTRDYSKKSKQES